MCRKNCSKDCKLETQPNEILYKLGEKIDKYSLFRKTKNNGSCTINDIIRNNPLISIRKCKLSNYNQEDKNIIADCSKLQRKEDITSNIISNIISKDGFIPINNNTNSEVIDNILKHDEWAIEVNVTIKKNSRYWRKLFHYGHRSYKIRAPAMWIFPNNPWKFHLRMKTKKSWNDGINFDIPKQFQKYNKLLNIRILHSKVRNQSIINVFINDIKAYSMGISPFQPQSKKNMYVKNNSFNDFIVSNVAMKRIIKNITLNDNIDNDNIDSEVIDNIFKKDEWEIKMNLNISENSPAWRNIFHYGNNSGIRSPAMDFS